MSIFPVRGVPCVSIGFHRPFKTIGRLNCLLILTAFTHRSDAQIGSGAPAPAASTVTLAWNASMDHGVVGYDVYYGGASRGYTNKTATGLVYRQAVSNLTVGIRYYFAVTARNASGVEGDFSNEVAWTVTNPPPVSLFVTAPLTEAVQTTTAEVAVANKTADPATAPAAEAKPPATTARPALSPLGAKPAAAFATAAAVPAPPPGLQLAITPDQQVILTVTGPANHTYAIQAAPDLVSWTVIGTAAIGDSRSLSFADTNAAGFSSRFYRTADFTP